jgi:rSAM/selenodomain-associated transferase 2
MISAIVPTLNEENSLSELLATLCDIKEVSEILVADGGSADNTRLVSSRFPVKTILARKGRGPQLKAGALLATNEILWFIHADAMPDIQSGAKIVTALASDAVSGGNLSIHFCGNSQGAKFLNWLYPKLSYLGLCYGDSAFFMRKSAYNKVGGFREIPLFEDLDLLRRLRKDGRFVTLPCFVRVSSRRFEGRWFVKTFTLWCALQLLYWVGVSPVRLAGYYKHLR